MLGELHPVGVNVSPITKAETKSRILLFEKGVEKYLYWKFRLEDSLVKFIEFV